MWNYFIQINCSSAQGFARFVPKGYSNRDDLPLALDEDLKICTSNETI